MLRAFAVTVLSFLLCPVVAIQTFAEPTAGKLSGRLVVEGSGDSQELLRAIARRFERLHPGTFIEVPDSVGSTGGISKLVEGEIELARTARLPLDKELNYGLTSSMFARSPIVFAVNPSVKGIENLTYEQVADIYDRKITDWSQLSKSIGKIYLVSRETGDSCRMVLNDLIPGFSEVEPPVGGIFHTTPEALDAIVEHENTIGYGPLSMSLKASLKILRLNGIYPSAENVRNGSYKLAVPLFVVYKEGNLSPLAAALVDFLYSEEGRKIIMDYGSLPVDRD